MRVLLIHQAFVSPSEAGGTRHFELAKLCREYGWQIDVVASQVSYLTGEPVPGAKGWWSEEDIAGVRVFRAYACRTLHRTFFWRVVSFLTFMVTSAWAGIRVQSPDIVMGTTPPIFQALSAWLVSRVRRRPFILEVRDLWPDFAMDMGVLKNPFLIRLSRRLEKFLYCQARHVVVNSPAYKEHVVRVSGRPASEVSIVTNGVDVESFSPESAGTRWRDKLGLSGKFVVVYAGALGIANDLATLLRSARLLLDRPSVQLVIAGDGKERINLERIAAEMELRNVTFLGAVPKNQMGELLAAADACLALLQPIKMFRTTYPNKVFDYMAAGRGVILAIDGVIREVIETAGAGVFVPPGDPEKLALAIRTAAENPQEFCEMGARGRAYAVAHFDRKLQANRLVRVFELVQLRNSSTT